ncbi:DNA pilot protein [robinz microvirus RP_56]|nr:DNA pilot protein [robinz microvirus RP_56]
MLGALIAAGASLAGAYLSSKSQKETSQQSMQQSYELQKKMIGEGFHEKVKAAKEAGISPLYALGAPTTSFAPSSIGTSGIGPGVADAGQHIGRAITATEGAKGRASVLATELAQTQIEGLKLDNDIKRTELLSRNNLRTQPGQPPGVSDIDTTPMVAGQGDAAAKIKLQKEIAPAGSQPQKSFGVSPEVDMWRTKHGYAPEVPQALGEAQESQPLSAAQWFMRNKIMPTLSDSYKTFPYEAPEGKQWQFNPLFGEYVLVPKGSSWRDYIPSWRRIKPGS